MELQVQATLCAPSSCVIEQSCHQDVIRVSGFGVFVFPVLGGGSGVWTRLLQSRVFLTPTIGSFQYQLQSILLPGFSAVNDDFRNRPRRPDLDTVYHLLDFRITTPQSGTEFQYPSISPAAHFPPAPVLGKLCEARKLVHSLCVCNSPPISRGRQSTTLVHIGVFKSAFSTGS